MNPIRRTTFTLAMLMAFGVAACGSEDAAVDQAEQAGEMADDPDIAPAGEAMALPAGFAMRLDRADAVAADFRAMTMGDGVHVQTGPAGVLYDEGNTVASGDYTLSATFTEIGAPPNHREGLGLIFGGSDLQGENQAYAYFLVRADGRYIVKRRLGAETMNVTDGWIESPAIAAATAEEDVTNALEVQVVGDEVHFRVNGTEVTTVPADDLGVYGIAGVRINHNLNVRVADWSLAY